MKSMKTILALVMLCPVAVLSQIVWYASPTGTGVGTVGDPSSFAVALLHTHPDTTVMLRGGVYLIGTDMVTIGKGYQSGTDSSKRAIIRNYPGEIPVLSRTDSVKPYININSATKIIGLWFVGVRKDSTYPTVISWDVDMDSCVNINTGAGVLHGQGVRCNVRNSLFIRCGLTPLGHSIYYASDDNGSVADGDTLYRNVIVLGQGMAINFRHYDNVLGSWAQIIRNFVWTSQAALGNDALYTTIKDNVWGTNGIPSQIGTFSLEDFATARHNVYVHNFLPIRRGYGVFLWTDGIDGEPYSPQQWDTIGNNYRGGMHADSLRLNYTQDVHGYSLANINQGSGGNDVDSSTTVTYLGLSAVQIDSVVEVLNVATTNKTLAEIQADATIVDARATLWSLADNWAGALVTPFITVDPVSGTTARDATRVFSVTATGDSKTYQWQKNSVSISGATSSSYSCVATYPDNSGAQFRCIVTNAAGSDTSASATLSIQLARKWIAK